METKKLQELQADMTQEEKIGQLLQLDGAFFNGSDSFATGPAGKIGFKESDRWLCGSVLNVRGAAEVRALQEEYMAHHPHHIPLLFMLDIINGYRTVYPIPLAQGCTFDPELVRCAACATAHEASADGIHLTFSPMADLVQDSRWGRVMESTGEDPLLNSRMAAAMVRGYQGENLAQPGTLAACVKHFAAYGRPDAGREYSSVELSERTLYEDYLPAYRAAIDAGAATVMTSFNTLDRIPSTGNSRLMRNILRAEFGFKGVLISDYAAIAELMAHGIAESPAEAAKLSICAGVDIDMMSSTYVRCLSELIENGKVPQELLEETVSRILALKNRLGLFEDPYHGAAKHSLSEQKKLDPQSCAAARLTAEKSMVLLKNEKELLPLSARSGRIAFIGPYVDAQELYGAWSIQANAADTVTIRQAARTAGIDAEFYSGCACLEPGTVLEGLGGINYVEPVTAEESEKMQSAAVEAAKTADTVVLCLGEHRFQSGEGGSRADITLPALQKKLLRNICRVNSRVVLVLFSGRPLDISDEVKNCDAVLEAWFPGTEGGNAVMDLLLGHCMPEGRLSMCFPRCVGQLPISYRALRTGRPAQSGVRTRFCSAYQDVPNTPLYPFGYGLSYTSFSYSEPTLSTRVLHKGEMLRACATVTNTGGHAAAETPQLYLQDCCGSVCRPMRMLKDFTKVTLAPGESRLVSFALTEEMLRFYTADGTYRSEPGRFLLWIGADSACEPFAEFILE